MNGMLIAIKVSDSSEGSVINLKKRKVYIYSNHIVGYDPEYKILLLTNGNPNIVYYITDKEWKHVTKLLSGETNA